MWILIAFLLLLFAALIVLIPLFRTPSATTPDITVDPKLLALYNRRDQLYQAIREAKFDLDTGKLSPEDYERQVQSLKRQAASVLKAIDRRQAALFSADLDAEAEALIQAARTRSAEAPLAQPVVAVAAGGSASPAPRYCPQCGVRVQPGDRFCPACGARLR